MYITLGGSYTDCMVNLGCTTSITSAEITREAEYKASSSYSECSLYYEPRCSDYRSSIYLSTGGDYTNCMITIGCASHISADE